MSDQNDKPRRFGSLWKWIAWFVALLIAYPLSFGPIYAMWLVDWMPDEVFEWLLGFPYRPLSELWTTGHNGGNGVAEVYDWYMSWWYELANQ